MMANEIQKVKVGLAITFLGLFFGVTLGITFGVSEDLFKDFIASGIAASPELHDGKSADKIWRYAQRAHFHALGLSAISIGLIILILIGNMKSKVKSITSILVGFSSFYPLSWLSMFLLAPSLGREAAHSHLITELFTYAGVGGLLLGCAVLTSHLFFGAFARAETQ